MLWAYILLKRILFIHFGQIYANHKGKFAYGSLNVPAVCEGFRSAAITMKSRVYFLFLIIVQYTTCIQYLYAESLEDYLDRAETCSAKNEYEKALSYIEEAIKIDPDNPQSYVYASSAYFQLHNTTEALRNVYLAIEKDNTYAEAYNTLGTIYLSLA
jgi:tetratricopeptide (TPR) repeat protein